MKISSLLACGALTLASFCMVPGVPARAQNIRLPGTITDQETSLPVVHAHIHVMGSNLGTVSNVNGDFVLLIPSKLLPDSIIVSHLGYNSLRLAVDTTLSMKGSRLEIQLMPGTIELPSLVVRTDQKSLIEEAIEAIPRNYYLSRMKLSGFFRATMTSDSTYIQVSETLFNAFRVKEDKGEFDDRLAIVKGRMARDSVIFQEMSNIHAGVSPKTILRNAFFENNPLVSPKFVKNHEFELEGGSTYGGRSVYVLKFDRKKKINGIGWRGTIYLEQESLAFVKIVYGFSPRNPKDIKLFDGSMLTARLVGLSKSTFQKIDTEMNYTEIGGKWYLKSVNYDAAWTMVGKGGKVNRQIDYKGDLVITDIIFSRYKSPAKDVIARQGILEENARYYSAQTGFWDNDNHLLADRDLEGVFAAILARNKEHQGVQ